MAAVGPQQRTPHVVNLKVLRAARPTLARRSPAAVPYYDGGGGDSEHGLGFKELYQGRASDPSEPLSGFMLLPSAFGSIYLGETFSAVLCLSNDTDDGQVALSPVMKVELHTFTQAQPNVPANKYALETLTADSLAPGASIEAVATHEIKDLANHALVCTVTYGVVANGQTTTTTSSRSFRKVYKFAVANPLSVRTKAHSPSPDCATSMLSPTERNKVFLEVQLQPQCDSPMSFERLTFLPVEGYRVLADDKSEPSSSSSSSSSSELLLPPHCVRQNLYILEPVPADRPVKLAPGSSQPLGKLDIVWRTANGELGRLQTSMLGRKVPLLTVGTTAVSSQSPSTKKQPSTPPPPTISSSLPKQQTRLSSETPTGSPKPYVRATGSHNLVPTIGTPESQSQAQAEAKRGQYDDLAVERIEPGGAQTVEEPFTIRFRLALDSVTAQEEGGKFGVAYVAQSARRIDNSKPSTALPDLTFLGPSVIELESSSSSGQIATWDMTFVSFEPGLFAVGAIRLVRDGTHVVRQWANVAEVWVSSC